MDNDKWREAIAWTKTQEDRLGRKIDKDIEEVIAALHLMDINTTMSCGGHLDRHTNGPYVTFGHKDVFQYKEICSRINNPSDENFKIAVSKAKELNFIEREKVWKHLESFYRDRSVSYECQLVIEVRPFSNNLYCQGAINVAFKNRGEREIALQAYRREMKQFAEYLKAVYLAGNNK